MVRDSTLIPHVLWFEYTSSRSEARYNPYVIKQIYEFGEKWHIVNLKWISAKVLYSVNECLYNVVCMQEFVYKSTSFHTWYFSKFMCTHRYVKISFMMVCIYMQMKLCVHMQAHVHLSLSHTHPHLFFFFLSISLSFCVLIFSL